LPLVKRPFHPRFIPCIPLTSLPLALLVALLLPSTLHAADIDPASPAGAMKSFYQALESNDAAAVRALFYTASEPEKQLADAYAAQLTAARALGEAAKNKFGATGDALSKGIPVREEIARLNTAKVSIEGDKATLTLADQSKPLHLIKSEGRWRLAISDYAGATPTNIAVQTRVLTEMAGIFDSVASDISLDKFPTSAEAQRALQQKLQAVLFNTLQKNPPTTAPTSKPATTRP
jgi:hypothetical protein